MDRGFIPPKTDLEFEQRSEGVTLHAAQNVKQALIAQRSRLTKSLDAEIAYYDRIIAARTNDQND